MLDKSGNGNHATQATASKRPTYTEGGGLAWLAFDGVDDGMMTGAIDLSGTDKVSLFAGVRKLSDDSTAIVSEFGASSSDVGSFLAGAPTNNSMFTWGAGGTTSRNITTSNSDYSAPTTRIFTGLADLAAPSSSMRIDGVQAASGALSLGSGNFGNYALNIGSRYNGYLFFEGNMHGLIVRGSTSSAAEIASTEAYMAAKTGVTL
jgi:hypothetical protein